MCRLGCWRCCEPANTRCTAPGSPPDASPGPPDSHWLCHAQSVGRAGGVALHSPPAHSSLCSRPLFSGPQSVGCAGDVVLHEAPGEDFARYGIEIRCVRAGPVRGTWLRAEGGGRREKSARAQPASTACLSTICFVVRPPTHPGPLRSIEFRGAEEPLAHLMACACTLTWHPCLLARPPAASSSGTPRSCRRWTPAGRAAASAACPPSSTSSRCRWVGGGRGVLGVREARLLGAQRVHHALLECAAGGRAVAAPASRMLAAAGGRGLLPTGAAACILGPRRLPTRPACLPASLRLLKCPLACAAHRLRYRRT